MLSQMDKLTPEQVQEASSWYQKKYGESFAAEAADEIGTDTREWQGAQAELRGDKGSADMHRIKLAALDEDKWFTAGMIALAVVTGPVGWAVLEAGLAANAAGLADNPIPWVPNRFDDDLLEKTLKAGKEGRGGRDPDHLKKVMERFNGT